MNTIKGTMEQLDSLYRSDIKKLINVISNLRAVGKCKDRDTILTLQYRYLFYQNYNSRSHFLNNITAKDLKPFLSKLPRSISKYNNCFSMNAFKVFEFNKELPNNELSRLMKSIALNDSLDKPLKERVWKYPKAEIIHRYKDDHYNVLHNLDRKFIKKIVTIILQEANKWEN